MGGWEWSEEGTERAGGGEEKDEGRVRYAAMEWAGHLAQRTGLQRSILEPRDHLVVAARSLHSAVTVLEPPVRRWCAARRYSYRLR